MYLRESSVNGLTLYLPCIHNVNNEHRRLVAELQRDDIGNFLTAHLAMKVDVKDLTHLPVKNLAYNKG